MANLYTPSLDRATDSNGVPVSGAKMYFYLTETSTPQDTYTDGDGLFVSTNPVVADSSGMFDPVFLDPTVVYRVRLTNSTGSEVYYDVDPVRGGESSEVVLSGMSMDTDRLLGRTSPGTGAVEQIALSGAFYFENQLLEANDGILIACSDETTALTAGTAKRTFRMPFAATLTGVRASVNTAPTGQALIVDINESGTTVLSTKLSIDAGEKTSTTAASAAVISDTVLADDAEITIDIDQVGSGTAGGGLKVALFWRRT